MPSPMTPASPLHVQDAAVGPAEDQVFDLPTSPLSMAGAGLQPATAASFASNDSERARVLRGAGNVGAPWHRHLRDGTLDPDRSNDVSVGAVQTDFDDLPERRRKQG